MATGRIPTTANSPLTVKGDLFGYSTTQARVPVGNDGETLVADSSATTGLRYQGNFAAGKNKVINGDFGIWQRGTTFTSIASNAYSADRWVVSKDKTATITQQTFTPGTAPVAGYEGQFFFRQVISGGSFYALIQKIENVRQFAGQTITLSYWAKADASVTNTAGWAQNFGSGGSSQEAGYASNNTITTSWQRFTATFAIPSISGKTIGTSSFFGIQPILIQNATTHTIDVWGMQLEVGSTATAFQTATGTIQGELSACQRYYWRIDNGVSGTTFGMAEAEGTNTPVGFIQAPVTMRIAPTLVQVTGTAYYAIRSASGYNTFSSFIQDNNSVNGLTIYTTSGTITSGFAGRFITNNAAAFLAMNSEL